MKPFQGCYYLGAHRAFSGVKSAFLVVHSVSGCAWGALALRHLRDRADFPDRSTVRTVVSTQLIVRNSVRAISP